MVVHVRPSVAAQADQMDADGRPTDALVLRFLGPEPPLKHLWSWADWRFSAWVLRRCAGDRPVSPRIVFFRCLGCHRIVLGRDLSRGPCRCGSNRFSDCVEPVRALRGCWLLARGRLE